MYFITSILCNMQTKGIQVHSKEALNDTVSVMKWIFTPVNSMVVLSVLGNIFGKVKDSVIGTDKAGKYLMIAVIVFIIIFIFEGNYISNFITGLLASM